MPGKHNQPPPIYDHYHKNIAKRSNRKIFLISLLLLPLALLAVRLGNHWMIWHTNKLELLNRTAERISLEYHFKGYYFKSSAEKEFSLDAGLRSANTIVHSYFDIYKPLIFLINKQDSTLFTDLGRIALKVEPGMSTVSLNNYDRIHITSGKGFFSTIASRALLKPLFLKINQYLAAQADTPQLPSGAITYILKSPEQSKYLRFRYLLYFVIPLVVIPFLAYRFTNASFVSFFYYFECLFLFDAKTFFFTGPFHWFWNSISVEINPFLQWGFIVGLFVPITYLFIRGITHWRQSLPGSFEKLFVALFFLLPLFLGL